MKICTQISASGFRWKINVVSPRLRVGAFDVGVLVFSAAAIFLASVHGKCLRYTEDVDVVFTKKNSSLLTLERGRWIRMLCDSSNLQKQKLVRPKPLASKMVAVKKVGQKNGEVGLLVEYLFCGPTVARMTRLSEPARAGGLAFPNVNARWNPAPPMFIHVYSGRMCWKMSNGFV